MKNTCHQASAHNIVPTHPTRLSKRLNVLQVQRTADLQLLQPARLTGNESDVFASRIRGKPTLTPGHQVCCAVDCTPATPFIPTKLKSLCYAPSTTISSQSQQFLKRPVPPHNKGFYFPIRSLQDCNISLRLGFYLERVVFCDCM